MFHLTCLLITLLTYSSESLVLFNSWCPLYTSIIWLLSCMSFYRMRVSVSSPTAIWRTGSLIYYLCSLVAQLYSRLRYPFESSFMTCMSYRGSWLPLRELLRVYGLYLISSTFFPPGKRFKSKIATSICLYFPTFAPLSFLSMMALPFPNFSSAHPSIWF